MHKPSPATVIATVALFVALGGVGVAATGGNFILGQANTATTNTSLSAPVAGGKTIQLTNNDTTNNASTALGLNVASGHAPFTVNTGAKVANLNADQLDSHDSSYFLPSTGKAVDSDKLGGQLPSYYLPASGVRRVGPITVAATTPETDVTLITIGQLSFTGRCYRDAKTGTSQLVGMLISSSADHSAYTDSFNYTDPSGSTAYSSPDMHAATPYDLMYVSGISPNTVFDVADGAALSADGHEVVFNLFMGQNVRGSDGACVFGGSLVVK